MTSRKPAESAGKPAGCSPSGGVAAALLSEREEWQAWAARAVQNESPPPRGERGGAAPEGGAHLPLLHAPRAPLSSVGRTVPFFPLAWGPFRGRMACLSGQALRVRDLDDPKGHGAPRLEWFSGP